MLVACIHMMAVLKLAAMHHRHTCVPKKQTAKDSPLTTACHKKHPSGQARCHPMLTAEADHVGMDHM